MIISCIAPVCKWKPVGCIVAELKNKEKLLTESTNYGRNNKSSETHKILIREQKTACAEQNKLTMLFLLFYYSSNKLYKC